MRQTIACPICDVMYQVDEDIASAPTVCRRCGHRLTYGKSEAIGRVVGLATTSLVLMGLVLFYPLLDLTEGTMSRSASVVDAVNGFSGGIMAPLSLAVLAFIIVLPLARFSMVVYALGPVAFHRAALPGAAFALRWVFLLKPWAMAEVFMIGVGVALVKLAGMASVGVGPAFWAFTAVVLIAAYQDTFMCRHTLWTELNDSRR